MTTMDEARLKQLASEAADEAVKRTLIGLGIDHEHPLEAQRDMAALREIRSIIEDPETQKDLQHLRNWRKAMDSVQSRGIIGALGLMALGGCALILYAVNLKLGGH